MTRIDGPTTKKIKPTSAEFARLVGVSRQAVGKAAQLGRVKIKAGVIDPTDPINVLFLEQTKISRAKNTASRKRAESAGEAIGSGSAPAGGLLAEKLRREIERTIEQTRGLRLKHLRTIGRLLDREQVEQAMARFNAELEVRLLDLPRRIGPRLAALGKSGEEAAVITALEDEITAALRHAKQAARV